VRYRNRAIYLLSISIESIDLQGSKYKYKAGYFMLYNFELHSFQYKL